MTVQEFAEKCNKRVSTVLKWLEAGFVPGVVMKDGEYVIPQSARKPYTECRAKGGKAILKSIWDTHGPGCFFHDVSLYVNRPYST